MPPITTKETQRRIVHPANPFAPTYNPQLKYHGIDRLSQTPDSTILNHNFSVPLHPVPGINDNKPSIPHPKSQAYYAIKSTPQDPEPKSPSPKPSVPLLTPAIRQELWAIWKADPRVPTIASRHAWAASRGVSSARVDQWFSARKSKAKKSGRTISDGSYAAFRWSPELSGVPMDIQVKREHLSPSPSPSFSDYTDVNMSSDDTLVSFGDCGSDVSYTSSRSSPRRGHAYIRCCGKDLYRYASLKRVWCLSDAYTHIATALAPNYPKVVLDKLIQQSIFPLDIPPLTQAPRPAYARLGPCPDIPPPTPRPAYARLGPGPDISPPTPRPAYARLGPGPDTAIAMEHSIFPHMFGPPGLAVAPTPSGFPASWIKGGT
ncbi:hypothetical protein EDD22DRAFT_876478 [Suillus occidentalis]|nr:hypothetical protein EDD22DRAFT_876478 [Suillus occidentalis]